MLLFSGVMLVLLAMAYFRGPTLHLLSPFWFFLGWLPGELPWLFGWLQALALIIYVSVVDISQWKDIAIIIICLTTIYFWYRLHVKTFNVRQEYQHALRAALGTEYEADLRQDKCVASPSVIELSAWKKPFSFKRDNVQYVADIAYGSAPRQRLDIYRQAPTAEKNSGTIKNTMLRPVLLHIHGGAWLVGHKRQQGQPLMQYLVQNGWLCVDINYRLAPSHRLPTALVDVKKALVWLKENIADYGGDPEFIALTGGSAGGHLCALAALTANQPIFQPGFEHRDTSVQAAIPVYGVYDFTNHQRDGSVMRIFLAKYVMPLVPSSTDFWQHVSPLFQVHDKAPPMFVIHGDKDCVVPVEQAQDFVAALRKRSTAPVAYAELKGAQHGFDVFHAVRTEFHIEAVGQFLHHCYSNRH